MILSNATDEKKTIRKIINDNLVSCKKGTVLTNGKLFTVKDEPNIPERLLNEFKQERQMEKRAQEFCSTISGILNSGNWQRKNEMNEE